jgi:zinc protease
MADLVRNPTFPAGEVERKRKQTISALDLLRDDPEYMADALFEVLVFHGTAYGHPMDGTVDSVRRMTPEDLRRFHAAHYFPANSILTLVGDVTTEEARSRAEQFFGDWKGPASAATRQSGSETVRARRIVVVDKPDAVQTEIRVGNRTVARDSGAYPALLVANQVLGGPAVNWLFRQLRSRRGLAYGASSELQFRRGAGQWMAKTSTRTAQTIPALRTVLEEITRLGAHDLNSRDLRMAQSYLVGNRALEFETSGNIAEQTVELLLHGLPLSEWASYAESIHRVSAANVREVGLGMEASGTQQIVLVGDARRFARELRRFGAIEIIPLDDLDLASPRLRRSAQ